MEKVIQIGPELSLDVKLANSQITIAFTYQGKSGPATLSTTQDAKYLLEQLKVQTSNAIIDGFITALEAGLALAV